MRLQRNRRGVSMAESIVSLALTGGLIATATSLLVFFSTESAELSQRVARQALRKEVMHTVGPALDGMIFLRRVGPNIPNGPVNATFQQTTVSATWRWRNDPKHMAQLYPGLVGLQQSSGICLPDKRTFLIFDKTEKTLQLEYYRRQEGRLVECLGGTSAERDHIGPITWKSITDVQLVKVGETDLELWIRFEGKPEWYSMASGLVED